MKLVYGTTNKAKIEFMKKHTDPLGLEILSLSDVNAPKLDIDESGNTPLENARIKALAYYQTLRQPVFSCDSALYIDGLDEARQPGAHIRSVGGRELNDDETTAYFSELAAELGGSMTARYQHAICLVLDESRVYEYMGADIASEPFLIVSKPHEKCNEGFPIDRLSVHIESGKYYYDMDGSEKELAEGKDGFAAFFKRVLPMVVYEKCDSSHFPDVLKLQHEWFNENITFGIAPDTAEDIVGYLNNYFYVAQEVGCVIGYVTAEVINDNEYNVFPNGANYLRVNDLYVAKGQRNRGIGEKLLSLVEQEAFKNGIQHIFISSATKDADAVRRFYLKNGYGIWTTSFYKRNDWDVRVYPLNDLCGYRFVVIFARCQDKWLYCRAKERDTFETAGGRIEPGETPLEAARRELYEETGAVRYDIKPVFDYSVHTPTDFSNGQVFFALVHELGDIPDFEMAEVKLFDTTPDKMRFPKILPVLFEKAKEML